MKTFLDPRTLLLCLLSFYFLEVFAQESHVAGHVFDDHKHPISLATVSVHDTAEAFIMSTTTDKAGLFSFRSNRKGKYFIRIRHVGFRDYHSDLFAWQDLNIDTIQLVPLTNTLDVVEVNSNKKVLEIDGGTIKYHVENTISEQDISVLEALKQAPSVYVENESNITLNGKAGVQLLLDGRPTYLSGAELIDLLKSLSSNQVRTIEIINSPTAKYDAAGPAGIINIKTKKKQLKGINGSVTSTLAFGVSAKQLQNMSLSYRLNKINIFGTYNHTLGNYNYSYGTYRLQNGKAYDSHTQDVDKRQKMSSQIGADYYIDDQHTIGFVAQGNFIFGGGITNTRTDMSYPPMNSVAESLDAINDYYGQGTARYTFSANYKYEDTSGYSLVVDADYGLFDKWNKNLQSNRYSDHQGLITDNSLYRTLNGINIDLMGIKVDYSMNLWKGKLESGLKFSQVGSTNDSRFFHVSNSRDSLDVRRSNDFQFEESITAAYVDYKRTLGKYALHGGLRLENSSSKGHLFDHVKGQDPEKTIPRNFTNLFPFFSISTQSNIHNTITFSYAKRIDRPAYQELNPFIYMLDELSFWQGNPFLNPSLTDRLTFLYAYKSSTLVTLNFAYTDQLTAKVIDTLDTEKIVMISKNLGTQKHWSLHLTQNIGLQSWWDLTFNGLLYYIHNDVSFDVYRNFNLQQIAGRISLLQSFTLPFKVKGEMTAIYHSKRLSGANTLSRSSSQLDLGLQKAFFKDRATLRIAFSDIYKGNKSSYTQNFPGFYSSSYGYYESRQARLSFSYRFSQGNSKAQRTRKSALETESGRM